MHSNPALKALTLPALLIAVMALTRFHHFGSAFSLPDASLAVFFFAGFYARRSLFILLLAEAALIDYLAISGGVSSFCVSPAYLFLLPTYAVMWAAGRWIAATTTRTATLLNAGLILTAATTVAFLISNGSFYLLSGRIAEASWYDYSLSVLDYYPPYAGYTLLYAGIGYLIKLCSDKLLSAVQQRYAH